MPQGVIPVIAGAGSNNTVETVRLVQAAKAAGADAALVVTPYYNKPTQRGLIAHFEAAAAVGLPIIIYNIPGRSVVDMTPETMGALAKLPMIVGVKDATGDLSRVPKQRMRCGDDFCAALGRRCYRPRLQRPRRGGLYLGHRQYRGQTLRGVPRNHAGWRLRQGADPTWTALCHCTKQSSWNPVVVGAKYGMSLCWGSARTRSARHSPR